MKREETSFHAILATSEYRRLDDLDRAVKLVEDGHMTQRKAAKACNVKRGALRRGLKTKKRGGVVGVSGRPRLMNPAEEEKLVSLLEDADNKKTPVKLSCFQDMV